MILLFLKIFVCTVLGLATLSVLGFCCYWLYGFFFYQGDSRWHEVDAKRKAQMFKTLNQHYNG